MTSPEPALKKVSRPATFISNEVSRPTTPAPNEIAVPAPNEVARPATPAPNEIAVPTPNEVARPTTPAPMPMSHVPNEVSRHATLNEVSRPTSPALNEVSRPTSPTPNTRIRPTSPRQSEDGRPTSPIPNIRIRLKSSGSNRNTSPMTSRANKNVYSTSPAQTLSDSDNYSSFREPSSAPTSPRSLDKIHYTSYEPAPTSCGSALLTMPMSPRSLDRVRSVSHESVPMVPMSPRSLDRVRSVSHELVPAVPMTYGSVPMVPMSPRLDERIVPMSPRLFEQAQPSPRESSKDSNSNTQEPYTSKQQYSRMSVENVKSTLWNNLPYCGVYKESPFIGEYTNFKSPKAKTVFIKGYPVFTNSKRLKLITFSGDSFANHNNETSVTIDQGWRLITYSQWLEYKIKWTVSEECNIGFYTPNYLFDHSSLRKQMLIIGDSGLLLLKGTEGTVCFTGIVEFCVVVDKDVEATLEIRHRTPISMTFEKLDLNVPVQYSLNNGRKFAYEMKTSEEDLTISYAPEDEYIELVEAMKKQIMDSSIILRPDVPVQDPPTKTFKNLKFSEPKNYKCYRYLEFPEVLEDGYGPVLGPNNKIIGLRFPAMRSCFDKKGYIVLEYTVESASNIFDHRNLIVGSITPQGIFQHNCNLSSNGMFGMFCFLRHAGSFSLCLKQNDNVSISSLAITYSDVPTSLCAKTPQRDISRPRFHKTL